VTLTLTRRKETAAAPSLAAAGSSLFPGKMARFIKGRYKNEMEGAWQREKIQEN
jgi:hypothetical protein